MTPGSHPPPVAAKHVAGTLTIVGYIGTGGTARMYEVDAQALEKTNAAFPIDQSTVALEIRDTSIMGVLPRNWLLLYDDERALPIPDLVGKLCVIAHMNHQITAAYTGSPPSKQSSPAKPCRW